MEPATKGSANPTPSSSSRQNKTIQAVLLFAFVVLVVFVLALVTNALGTNPTVLTQVTPGSKGTPNAFSNNGVQIPGPTLTAIALTPGATVPGQEQAAGSNGSASNAATANSAGNAAGSSNGNASGNANNGSTGSSNGNVAGSNGNSTNTGATGSNGNVGSSGSNSNTGAAGSTNGNTSTGNTGSPASGSLPGGSSSLPGGSTGSSNGSASGTNGTNGSASGPNGSSTGSNGSTTGGSVGSVSGATGGSTGTNGSTGSNSNANDTTGATVHQGNYVCATGGPGNLTYQSDFTILEGQKYRHSANPNQEFAFNYNSATRTITWVDGPNAGMLGTYMLPDGSHSFQIIEQNKTSDTALSCTLAEK